MSSTLLSVISCYAASRFLLLHRLAWLSRNRSAPHRSGSPCLALVLGCGSGAFRAARWIASSWELNAIQRRSIWITKNTQ